MIEASVIIQFVLTAALGVVGFFLRGIYTSIQDMAKSINTLNERLIRHETNNEATQKRADKVDSKLDELEREIHHIRVTISKFN
jgi:archaellum component FlaC